jgi:hypothetical protein
MGIEHGEYTVETVFRSYDGVDQAGMRAWEGLFDYGVISVSVSELAEESWSMVYLY